MLLFGIQQHILTLHGRSQLILRQQIRTTTFSTTRFSMYTGMLTVTSATQQTLGHASSLKLSTHVSQIQVLLTKAVTRLITVVLLQRQTIRLLMYLARFMITLLTHHQLFITTFLNSEMTLKKLTLISFLTTRWLHMLRLQNLSIL